MSDPFVMARGLGKKFEEMNVLTEAVAKAAAEERAKKEKPDARGDDNSAGGGGGGSGGDGPDGEGAPPPEGPRSIVISAVTPPVPPHSTCKACLVMLALLVWAIVELVCAVQAPDVCENFDQEKIRVDELLIADAIFYLLPFIITALIILSLCVPICCLVGCACRRFRHFRGLSKSHPFEEVGEERPAEKKSSVTLRFGKKAYVFNTIVTVVFICLFSIVASYVTNNCDAPVLTAFVCAFILRVVWLVLQLYTFFAHDNVTFVFTA